MAKSKSVIEDADSKLQIQTALAGTHTARLFFIKDESPRVPTDNFRRERHKLPRGLAEYLCLFRRWLKIESKILHGNRPISQDVKSTAAISILQAEFANNLVSQ